ncbi:hypothetical protein KIL84_010674 [Mauremys mutica]|uniref:Uncharacterized protein n=1 Tax=Mauremys mutica TaxID=74926 RepID=A0A9D3XCD3_9SAUR|nr:hypothetical protein KIL84_010674 [Mauremys mutica]
MFSSLIGSLEIIQPLNSLLNLRACCPHFDPQWEGSPKADDLFRDGRGKQGEKVPLRGILKGEFCPKKVLGNQDHTAQNGQNSARSCILKSVDGTGSAEGSSLPSNLQL